MPLSLLIFFFYLFLFIHTVYDNQPIFILEQNCYVTLLVRANHVEGQMYFLVSSLLEWPRRRSHRPM